MSKKNEPEKFLTRKVWEARQAEKAAAETTAVVKSATTEKKG